MAETTVGHDIQGLKDHVEARFAGLERWLERVSTAIEKHGENRERTIVLEARFDALERRVIANETRIEQKLDTLTRKIGDGSEKLITFGVYFAIAGTALSFVAPVILKKFLGV